MILNVYIIYTVEGRQTVIFLPQVAVVDHLQKLTVGRVHGRRKKVTVPHGHGHLFFFAYGCGPCGSLE